MSSHLTRIARSILAPLGLEVIKLSTAKRLRAHAFAQYRGDVLLDTIVRAELQQGRSPTFVQIGANDGVSDDRFHDIVRRHGLSGVLVEPLPDPFERLVQNYDGVEGLHFENVAVGPGPGPLTLFTFDAATEGGQALDPFASTSRSHLEEWKERLGLESGIVGIEVPTLSPQELADRHGFERFDIFVIDAEGFDYEIIRLIDFERHKPLVVQFEDVHLSEDEHMQCYREFAALGYGLARSQQDTFAIRVRDPR